MNNSSSKTSNNGQKTQWPYRFMPLYEASDYLRNLLGGFPFSDWREVEIGGHTVMQSRSMAVQVAAMLSLFCKAMLPKGSSRMGFIYNANSQRSGKTLLAKLAIVAVCGNFNGQPWKRNDEELNKLIDAEMLAGSLYICFDNVRGYLGSPILEGLMTAPNWTGRILSKSKMFQVPNNMTLFVTGNEVIISPDMDHRCLVSELFVKEGDVQEREHAMLIDDTWLLERENRINILSALYSIVAHWHQDGMPAASSFGYKPRLGFERWGDLIGGIVGYAGFGNCLERVELASGGNSEERSIRELIAAIVESDKTVTRVEKTFGDIATICHNEGLFDWILEGRKSGDDFELSPRVKSTFGLILNRYAPLIEGNRVPRKYHISIEGKTQELMFGCKGKGRHRRYFVDVMERVRTWQT